MILGPKIHKCVVFFILDRMNPNPELLVQNRTNEYKNEFVSGKIVGRLGLPLTILQQLNVHWINYDSLVCCPNQWECDKKTPHSGHHSLK